MNNDVFLMMLELRAKNAEPKSRVTLTGDEWARLDKLTVDMLPKNHAEFTMQPNTLTTLVNYARECLWLAVAKKLGAENLP